MWNLTLKKISKDYYSFSEDIKERFIEEFGVDKSTINKNIDEIRLWISQQSELPEDLEDLEFIENVFSMCKYKIEPTQQMIKSYFKTFTELSKLHKNNFDHYVQLNIDNGSAIAIKKLTSKNERVVIYKFPTGINLDGYKIIEVSMQGFPITLLTSHYHGAVPVRMIIDFEGLTMQHLKSLDLNTLVQIMNNYKQGLRHRVSGIEYINAPSYISGFVNIMKLLLPAKIFGRIAFHDNLESLHKNINKDILPIEFGGPELTIEDMKKETALLLEENMEFFEKLITFIPKDVENDSVFGAEGVFKTLSID